MERVIIFGASVGGERALRSLGAGQRAVAFSDNDKAKHRRQFHRLPVIAPAEIANTPHDRVLIASVYYAEIFDQLMGLGIPMEEIEILDGDVLDGSAERGAPRSWPWLVGGLLSLVVVALAVYGAYRLIAG